MKRFIAFILVILLYIPNAHASVSGEHNDMGFAINEKVGIWTIFLKGAEAGAVQLALDIRTIWHKYVTTKEPDETEAGNRQHYESLYKAKGRGEIKKDIERMIAGMADQERAIYLHELLNDANDIYNAPINLVDEAVLDELYKNRLKLNGIESFVQANSNKSQIIFFQITKILMCRILPILFILCAVLLIRKKLNSKSKSTSTSQLSTGDTEANGHGTGINQ